MSLTEFELIHRYFTALHNGSQVQIGVGDDAAVVIPLSTTQKMVVSSCVELTQNFNAQYPAACAARGIATIAGRLLARGARLQWMLLNLILPRSPDVTWVEAFSHSLKRVLLSENACLIGGDTCRGAATVVFTGISSHAITISDDFPQNGDLIYVTGTLGNQALALLDLQQELTLIKSTKAWVQTKLFAPTLPPGLWPLMQSLPVRVYPLELGLVDTLEFLDARKRGADIYLDQLPVDERCVNYLEKMGGRTLLAETTELGEFMVIVAERDQVQFETAAAKNAVPFTWIGTTTSTPGVRLA